jgi:hypothetical protein
MGFVYGATFAFLLCRDNFASIKPPMRVSFTFKTGANPFGPDRLKLSYVQKFPGL